MIASMTPILKRSVASLRYMAHTFKPGITMAILADHYRKTRDEGALEQMATEAEKLKKVVLTYYPAVDSSRIPSLLSRIDDYLKETKERYQRC